MATKRFGITLIETLVVLGIIGILLAIALPVVQSVREKSRQTTCQNNMRQLTLAILNHESAHSALPDLYNGTFLEHPRYAPDEFHYKKGKAVDPYPYHNSTSGMDHYQAAWAISTHFWWLVFWHEQGVNETNRTGVFSFHALGANTGLADGSVRFWPESVDQAVLNALATRSARDIVTLE